jgi:hypothetical protein
LEKFEQREPGLINVAQALFRSGNGDRSRPVMRITSGTKLRPAAAFLRPLSTEGCKMRGKQQRSQLIGLRITQIPQLIIDQHLRTVRREHRPYPSVHVRGLPRPVSSDEWGLEQTRKLRIRCSARPSTSGNYENRHSHPLVGR